MVEALACGTPVAAFDRGAMSEILTDTCGRLAAPGDVDALAEAAAAALRLDRADCRQHVETAFTLDTMLDRYGQL